MRKPLPIPAIHHPEGITLRHSDGTTRRHSEGTEESAFTPLPVPPDFIWATGIEDTFITAENSTTGRSLDEYALTEHYDKWREDIDLIASLGVKAARYGIPWHKVEPGPGEFDWNWTDQVLERLANRHDIEPIIDLVHYGTPAWLENSFLNPDYPQRVADYAQAFAEHYRGLCYWYTPLNEPRINAWYAGRLGWWPPYQRSWKGFLRVLLALCRGICLTEQAIRATEPDAVLVHVDASDLYYPSDPTDPKQVEEAKRREEIVYLALDLVQGRANRGIFGIPDSEIDWFKEHAARPDIIGFNMYPMFSRKEVLRNARGGLRTQNRPCWSETLLQITQQYAHRYPGTRLMITETAGKGTFAKRIKWIEDSVTVVKQARQEGIPLVGYTFWPLFSLVAWAYQRGAGSLSDYLYHIGLWDLQPGPNGLNRIETPVVNAYRKAVRNGAP